MDYKKIACQNYNIHLIKRKNYHTIDFFVYFTNNVTKEKITYYNVLFEMMLYANKTYDTKRKLIRKCQELYSLIPNANFIRYGNIFCAKIGMSIVSSKYINAKNINDNIALLSDILFNPLVTNKEFNKCYLDIIKNQLKVETKTATEDPRLYANLELLKKFGQDEIYALSGFCNLDILKKVNGRNLYDYYLDLINNSKIDFFIVGDIKNDEEIVETVKSNFPFQNNYELNKPVIYHEKKEEEIKVFKETKELQQSKLSIGCKLYDLSGFERRYVLSVFNEMFGYGGNCMLMKDVREKKALCYYIGSYINKLDNLMIINSGIKKENFDLVVQSIKEILDDVKKGHFTKKDIETGKTECLSFLQDIKNNNGLIMDYYYGLEVFKSDELDVKIKKIKSVTKENVMQLAKKINIEAIFCLEGDL